MVRLAVTIAVTLLIAGVLVLTLARHRAASPAVAASEPLAAGEQIYQGRCLACHGKDGVPPEGGIDVRYYAGTRAELATLLENGRGDMPPQLGLTAQEVASLHAYIGKLAASAP